eukprot:TRINITY_DN1085_c0_g1_i2.p1 TRINITY_DN1085_c0_g1~~TRINITY_DN1085_c0_g1_i2.p1  ORF type:complete len:112 (-),score=23.22 TRINITY_DN1085_c0_g1_i2:39-374(-)
MLRSLVGSEMCIRDSCMIEWDDAKDDIEAVERNYDSKDVVLAIDQAIVKYNLPKSQKTIVLDLVNIEEENAKSKNIFIGVVVAFDGLFVIIAVTRICVLVGRSKKKGYEEF